MELLKIYKNNNQIQWGIVPDSHKYAMNSLRLILHKNKKQYIFGKEIIGINQRQDRF